MENFKVVSKRPGYVMITSVRNRKERVDGICVDHGGDQWNRLRACGVFRKGWRRAGFSVFKPRTFKTDKREAGTKI